MRFGRNGTGRRTWPTTITWRKWKCRWTGKAKSAIRTGRKAPAIRDGTIRCAQAIAAVTNMDRPPPTNFPPRVTIRFDVQEETEPVLQ